MLASIMEIWNNAWLAGSVLLGLSGIFAVVLLIASIKLRVEVDPKVEIVRAVLPGIDCGSCGLAGCNAYAKAIIEQPGLIGKCAPGGFATSEKIAKILNLQVSGDGCPTRPIVHCNAHTGDKTYLAKYEGIPTCTAANALANVQSCKFGCLGFGDCVKSCKFGALQMVDGLATVDYEKCTGCMACSKACPRRLIEMVPFSQDNMMTAACRSRENGKTTKAMCKVGCIGCGLCAKQSDLFKVEDNFAIVDYKRYMPSEKTQAAMSKCPTKIIIMVGKTAQSSKSKPAEVLG